MSRTLTVLAALGAVLFATSMAAAEQPAAPGDRARFDQPWHIKLPRETLLAAWKRLQALEIPGIPVDQRFQITGDTFYVSPAGDDAADGSQEHPWRTLAHAAKRLKPATVIYLRAGTYVGPAEINAKCSADKPAALRAAPGEEALVTYSEAWVQEMQTKLGGGEKVDSEHHYPPLISVSGTYVEISGLHLAGVRDRLPQNKYSENGISLAGRGGEGCRVLYNEIENVGHCGIKEMGHGGRAFLVEGNFVHDIGHTFHDHGTYLPADDVTVRKNLFLNATGWGVHGYSSPKRLFVSHNICAGNDCDGIIMAGPDFKVVHNILYKNKQGGLFFFRKECRNGLVANNVFVEPGGAVRYDCCGDKKEYPTRNVVDFNCLAPGTRLAEPMPGENKHGSQNLTADPKSAGARDFDFSVAADSPCVGKGTDVGLKLTGQPPDIGLTSGGRWTTKENATHPPAK
ncbi:MAG: right-handed parallel beta-helix repeat-containing protein [Planctomycetota bacterium]|nr:right-handed parallel beta-helix repeat-containing protein [Planctomycetota bacterium]